MQDISGLYFSSLNCLYNPQKFLKTSMSTFHIITAIMILFGLLLTFAFISQLQQKRKGQKNRLASALKARSRKVMNLLTVYPQNFLSSELQALLLNQLLETTKALIQLEPKDPSHKKNQITLSEKLDQVQSRANSINKTKLTDTKQIKEVHKNLEELYLFIQTLAQKQEISADQANNFNAQIKQLTFDLSANYNEISAKRELNEGKTKLAIHYFTQVITLHRGNEAFGNQDRASELESLVAELTEKLEEETRQKEIEATNIEENSKDGSNGFTEGDDLWKKKTMYD